MKIDIDNTNAWHFVNGKWSLTDRGYFQPIDKESADDGRGLQGYRFAFFKGKAFGNLQARFQVKHDFPRCDVAFIFGATSPQHFYALHFPDVGQASRAQNFWVVLSEMNETGVLRLHKLELVRRVASHPRGVWHDVEVNVDGDRVEVTIDARGTFSATLPRRVAAGYVGLASFIGTAQIRHLAVEGENVRPPNWSDDDRRQPNWFHPCPTASDVWQMPRSLVRDANGDLLLLYAINDKIHGYIHNVGLTQEVWLARSKDNGRTWGDPLFIERSSPQDMIAWRLHRFPDGHLRMVSLLKTTIMQRTTSDEGLTWSEPSAFAELGPWPAAVKQLGWGPQAFVNCRDGAIVTMLEGTPAEQWPSPNVYAWGAVHCDAYTARSTDGGRTWSAPIPMDGRGVDEKGNVIPCNMDLTEACVAEVNDNELLAMIRPIYSPWMWETRSNDGGQTWGPCVLGPFPGYATPNMLCTASGAVLVAHRILSLTIHCSLDRGVTWDNGTMIDSGAWVMGSMLEVEPDLVLYIYWDSFDGLMRGQFLRVGRNGLTPERNESPALARA